MKKLFAVFMIIAMLMSTVAIAEIADWTAMTLPDIGMTFRIPSDMVPGEPDIENNQAFCASNNELELSIWCINTGVIGVDAMLSMLEEQGFTVQVNALADAGLAYDHLCISMEGVDNYAGVVFMGSDGYYYLFESEFASENGAQLFGMVLGSLQPQQ